MHVLLLDSGWDFDLLKGIVFLIKTGNLGLEGISKNPSWD